MRNEKTTQDTLGEYVTTAKAALILGVTQRRVSQLCALGGLEAVKIARRWLVRNDAVYSLLRDRR